MGQDLEQPYNKIAEGKGCVIGITTWKATIAEWNLIKNEKMQKRFYKVLQVYKKKFYMISVDC